MRDDTKTRGLFSFWGRSAILLLLLGGCGIDNGFHLIDPTPSSPHGDMVPDPGSVLRASEVEDSFVIEGILSDIIVFGDTSGSMAAELKTMGDNVTRLLNRLDENQVDWQLMAVTGPDGCGQNGILTASTPDYAAKFAEGILQKPSADMVDEWGLHNTLMAVWNDQVGLCNEGFIRDNATLHVILVSDEDDNSPGFQEDADYWESYVDEIIAYKGDANRVKFSGVIGPVPDGCAGADPGYGYWEAIRATEGQFISICDDWPEQVDVLADSSVNQFEFALSTQPIPHTIRIWHNGEERMEGWRYVFTGNLVRFETDAPRGGDDVRIRFETYHVDP